MVKFSAGVGLGLLIGFMLWACTPTQPNPDSLCTVKTHVFTDTGNVIIEQPCN